MPHGLIKRVEPQLGFGFIEDDAGLDWFFVRENVRGGAIDSLLPKQRVTFEHEWTAKGPRAANIRLEVPQEAE